MKAWLPIVCIIGTLAGACGPERTLEPGSEVPTDLLAAGNNLVQVSRQAPDMLNGAGARPVGLGDGGGNFYLAIRKDALDQRWFLSAYMKQYHLGDAGVAAASTLGTRVVSFRVQNEKLFLFDASDAFAASALFDPEVLLEAYPIVHLPAFERLRGSEGYVLIDPADGLNRFSVTGELFADPYLSSFGAFPLRVGLSFMQDFRAIPDGATYEQVFSGEVDLGGGPQSVWGTLGLSLRRYSVGDGFVPTVDPGIPHYFLSDYRLIPDSSFSVEANPVHWNLHPGMRPIRVSITAGIQRAQADFPDIDLLGAVERGIEDWNDVLGFQAFDAVFVGDDDIRDPDQSTVLVDYPGAGNPFAFADWRSNPNNGEVLGGSVYFGGIFFQILPLIFQDDPPAARSAAAVAVPKQKPPFYSVLWGGMPARAPACVYWSPPYQKRIASRPRGQSSLTAAEKGSRYIQHVMAHEWGHVLGLRHNFKGSLLPPTSSVMEYAVDDDSVAQPAPGPYDVDAIGYLYQSTPYLPSQPFCTDEETQFDPNCVTFDSMADPLHVYWPPQYDFFTFLVLEFGGPLDYLEFGGLNEIAGYARDVGFVPPADRVFAADLALGRAKVPLAPADAADPDVVARVNAMAEFVLRRFVLDPPELRGAISFDLSDPGAIAVVSEQAGRMLRNEDGVRTYGLRRVAVDTLKKLQTPGALLELRAARADLETALANGLPDDEVPFAQDLLARIVAAVSPYFD